jgi:folate-binding protein YgfZ
MTDPATPNPPRVLAADAIGPAEAEAVLDGALLAEPDVALVDVTGPGAVGCIQGLLTNDVEKPGEGCYVYGAVLTPKGMIICDMWVLRERGSVRLTVPRSGLGALLDLFGHSLPPRLARPVERTDDSTVLHLVGPQAREVAARAGLAVPAEGRSTTAIVGESACVLARPSGDAPFGLEIVVSRTQSAAVRRQIGTAGAVEGSGVGLELARVLAGWPALGAEIDGRTLPQEVRYDEIGGVSYTKGCYTGQETVARLHFRGHPNRHLMGLAWDDAPDPAETDVAQDGKPRGRVTSIAWVAPLERYVGLGIVRREVELSRPVTAAGAQAAVVSLPFPIDA